MRQQKFQSLLNNTSRGVGESKLIFHAATKRP